MSHYWTRIETHTPHNASFILSRGIIILQDNYTDAIRRQYKNYIKFKFIIRFVSFSQWKKRKKVYCKQELIIPVLQ